MVTVVDATVPASQFALRDTAEKFPEAEFETLRVVAQNDGCEIPFLRAWAPNLDGLHQALEQDPTTREVERLVQREECSLYRIRWQARIRVVVYILGVEEGLLLRAHGKDGRWRLRVMFPDHDSISSTYEFCKENGIDLSIRRVKGIVESIDRHDNEITEKQYEALAAGFESDYYRVPRGQKLEGLADELDISHQALSERLRRGHRKLIEQTLL
jgi:predicted DNA binding protein